MRTPPTTNLLLLALLALTLTGVTACGGKAARERSQALLESQTGEKWFCQIAEDQTSWDCVQSNELAAAPAPERMPVPREELLALEVVEAEVDGADAIEVVAVETVAVEGPVVEAVAVETEVVEAETVETEFVETEVVDVEVDEPDLVEAETIELDTTVSAADSADRLPADLYTLPDDAYVVELVTTPSAQELESLVNDRGLMDVIEVRVAADGVFHHVLLTGFFADESSAQEFVELPPDQLQDFQLRVIPVRSLKVAMREADALEYGVADRGPPAGHEVAGLEVAQTNGAGLDPAVARTNPVDLPRPQLSSLPDDAYVVQLVAMRSAQTLDQLIEARGLTEVIPARVAADGEIYHILLIGPFDEPGAQEFAAAPPDHLQDFQPWVRSVSSLKAAMREADELSGDGLDDER
jgi:septal ring-binding cell division protein DamX